MESDSDGQSRNPSSAPEWENYIIPIFGLAIVVLVLLVLCQFYSRTLRKFCCPRSVQNRIGGEEQREGNDDETTDVPPSYSVLTQNGRTFDVFRVEGGDDRSMHSQQIETITDKLPSYKEILDAQKEEKTENDSNETNNNITPGENDNVSMETIVLEDEEEEEALPPPYRPQTARRIEDS